LLNEKTKETVNKSYFNLLDKFTKLEKFTNQIKHNKFKIQESSSLSILVNKCNFELISLINDYSVYESYSEKSRYLSLIILKNLISKEMKINNFQSLWNFLTSDIKRKLQQTSLALLASKSKKIRNASSILLSKFINLFIMDANYEEILNLTDNLFNVFVEDPNKLSSNILNQELIENIEIKKTSINAMIKISEEIYQKIKCDSYKNIQELNIFFFKILQIFLIEISQFIKQPTVSQHNCTNNISNFNNINLYDLEKFNILRLDYFLSLFSLFNSSFFFFEDIVKCNFSQIYDLNSLNDDLSNLAGIFLLFKNENKNYNNYEKFLIRNLMLEYLFNSFDKIFSFFIDNSYEASSNRDNFDLKNNNIHYFSNIESNKYLHFQGCIFKLLDVEVKIFNNLYDLFYDYLMIETDENYVKNFLYKTICLMDFLITFYLSDSTEIENTNIKAIIQEDQLVESIIFIIELFITIGQKELNPKSLFLADKESLFILDEYSMNLQNLKRGKIKLLNKLDFNNNKNKIPPSLHSIIIKCLSSFLIKDFSLNKNNGKNLNLIKFLSSIKFRGN